MRRAVFWHRANIQAGRRFERYTNSSFEGAMNCGCPNRDQPTHSDEALVGASG